jgi:hypothetical protein
MLFFFFWTWMFARFFDILGVNSEADQFEGLNRSGRYFMQVYENAIGNINAPNYTFWQPKDHVEDSHSHVVILTIWFIWFLNQWFIFMILLNFVIALIS